jgi:hypothetical protein
MLAWCAYSSDLRRINRFDKCGRIGIEGPYYSIKSVPIILYEIDPHKKRDLATVTKTTIFSSFNNA